MKKTIWVLWAVMGLMFLILCGCGDDDSGSSTGSLSLTNNTSSGLAITTVQIAPESASTWGPDQLGAEIIPSGTSFTFTNIAPGTYSMLVTLGDGQQLQWDNLNISAGATTNTIVSSAYKAAAKTIANPDSPSTNVNFTYIPANGNEGATKESPNKALKVSDQYVTEIGK